MSVSIPSQSPEDYAASHRVKQATTPSLGLQFALTVRWAERSGVKGTDAWVLVAPGEAGNADWTIFERDAASGALHNVIPLGATGVTQAKAALHLLARAWSKVALHQASHGVTGGAS